MLDVQGYCIIIVLCCSCMSPVYLLHIVIIWQTALLWLFINRQEKAIAVILRVILFCYLNLHTLVVGIFFVVGKITLRSVISLIMLLQLLKKHLHLSN